MGAFGTAPAPPLDHPLLWTSLGSGVPILGPPPRSKLGAALAPGPPTPGKPPQGLVRVERTSPDWYGPVFIEQPPGLGTTGYIICRQAFCCSFFHGMPSNWGVGSKFVCLFFQGAVSFLAGVQRGKPKGNRQLLAQVLFFRFVWEGKPFKFKCQRCRGASFGPMEILWSSASGNYEHLAVWWVSYFVEPKKRLRPQACGMAPWGGSNIGGSVI